MKEFNIGEIYEFFSELTKKNYKVKVVDHEFSDRHIWFEYIEKLDEYPLVNISRGNNNEFILPPVIANMVMHKI